MALKQENFEEAAYLRNAIAEADLERPTLAMECVLRERIRKCVDAALDEGAKKKTRLQAVEQLKALATSPGKVEEAEDGLHWVLQKANQDEIVQAAEAALWSSWMRYGEEVIDNNMRLGMKFMGAGRLHEAIQAFTEVVEAAPDFAEGWNKRATAHFLAERFKESIEDCARVLDLKPRHFGCLSGLGICHLRQGNESVALRWLRAALEVNPKSSDMQRIVSDLEARTAFAILRPSMQDALQRLQRLAEPQLVIQAETAMSRLLSVQTKVVAAWDAHRVKDLDRCTYYFRIRVENVSSEEVVSAARYYALRRASGFVFPLSRVTQGSSSFRLAAGESYAYSFMITMGEALSAGEGGLILRTGDELFEAELERLDLVNAPEIREADLRKINNGHEFMGRLEIKVDDRNSFAE